MKNLLSLAILTCIVFTPLTSFAETNKSIPQEQLILTLIQQIKELQSKVTALEKNQKELKSKVSKKEKSNNKKDKEATRVKKTNSDTSEITLKIEKYLIRLDEQISELRTKIEIAKQIAKSNQTVAVKTTTSVCAGTKTSNGCQLAPKTNSSHVGIHIDETVFGELVQRKESLKKIATKLGNGGVKELSNEEITLLKIIEAL
jgi:vacuolar-type H+-ATPase subunit I/STV1